VGDVFISVDFKLKILLINILRAHLLRIIKENNWSRSPSSTDKCQNCKAGRRDRVRTRDLTVVCEFNFSGLPLHLRQKKIKKRKQLINSMLKSYFLMCSRHNSQDKIFILNFLSNVLRASVSIFFKLNNWTSVCGVDSTPIYKFCWYAVRLYVTQHVKNDTHGV